ncbi:MAG: NB-ARC domain-containing protein, partial [Terriglobia bacterium]
MFINRQEHIKAIQEFLADDARRLVVVQGLPGIGKTLLAAKLAEALRARFEAVLWITCKDDQASPDVLFAKLHAFFEENGEHGLRGVWNDPSPDQLQMKINLLIHALDENSYLLIFDDFQNWLGPDCQLKNPEVRQVLATILGTAHQSKILLISDQRPLLDPMAFRLPVGATLESIILGLTEPNAIQLLNVTGLKFEDEALQNRIVQHCDGNPYMLHMFSYLVSRLHRDPEELLSSGETETKFNGLLQAATRDLSQDSRSALETLSIIRLPLSQRQLQALDLRFDKVIGPLLDRFLVIEDTPSLQFGVSTVVRNFIKGALAEPRRLQLHKQAVAFYVKQRRGRVPQNYEELQLALEEGYHRFEYGDRVGGADAIIFVTQLLVDWGYINLAEQNILQALNNTENDALKAQCWWLQGRI